MELELDSIHISIIANGYIVRLDFEGEGDEWKTEKFYFSTKDEVLAFLETNLD